MDEALEAMAIEPLDVVGRQSRLGRPWLVPIEDLSRRMSGQDWSIFIGHFRYNSGSKCPVGGVR